MGGKKEGGVKVKYLVIRQGNSFDDYEDADIASAYTFEADTPGGAATAALVDLFTECLGVEADGIAIECMKSGKPTTDDWLVRDTNGDTWAVATVSYPIAINILSPSDKPSISWSHAIAGMEVQ